MLPPPYLPGDREQRRERDRQKFSHLAVAPVQAARWIAANAVAESFFTSLKKERIKKRIYKTHDMVRAESGPGCCWGGIILGLVIPKIRWERHRGWGKL